MDKFTKIKNKKGYICSRCSTKERAGVIAWATGFYVSGHYTEIICEDCYEYGLFSGDIDIDRGNFSDESDTI